MSKLIGGRAIDTRCYKEICFFANPKKYHFHKYEVRFLGYVVLA